LALQKAKAKAEQIASATSVKLWKPLSINENNDPVWYPMPYQRNTFMAKEWGVSDSSEWTSWVAPGQLEIILRVNVVYEIK
jgi:uncharacterized protein YggE